MCERADVCAWLTYICMSTHRHTHVCEWVSGCSVLYASEPEPVGIRKVDLGHKYLISVCCPWKSSIYSWPDGKTRLGDPSPSIVDKKEMQLGEAVRGGLNLVWIKEEGGNAGRGRKKIKCSSASDEKSSLGSYRWIAFRNPLIVCLVRKEWWNDTKKAITDRKILDIMCLIPSYCQTE